MIKPSDILVVVADDPQPQVQQSAAALAERLDVRLMSSNERDQMPTEAILLAVTDDHLELRDGTTRPGRGVFVDFSTLNPRHAARRGGFSRNQPLGRAVGKEAQHVIDCTAGLAHDAALLACMGYVVAAVERSPVIAALIDDGVRRAALDPALSLAMGGRLTIVNADARVILQQRGSEFDVAYIDPMFPPKRKESALAKKNIRWVRQIAGDDEDAAELLEVARAYVKRVVVKRPTYAPPLHETPSFSITSKLVRYDVYLRT